MTLAPDTSGGNEEDGGSTRPEEVVPSQKRDLCEVPPEQQRDGDGIGSEDRAECGGKDAGEAENEGDEVAAPQRPIQGVVRIVGRLRYLRSSQLFNPVRTIREGSDEDDGQLAAGIALEMGMFLRSDLRPRRIVKVSRRA